MKITIMSINHLNSNPSFIEIDGVVEGGNYSFFREKMMEKYPPEIVLYNKEIELPQSRLDILNYD